MRNDDGTDRRKYLVENLRRFDTQAELRRSHFFAECRSEIESLFLNPEILHSREAVPRLRAFVRVVQWNIEKGQGFGAILDSLRGEETLKWADVVLLNEADFGMIRSGNRHVARCLAESLGMHLAFAPAHLELTKGTGEDLVLEGENREGLQGNAILSRHQIVEAVPIPLPRCFEPFEFHEKRYGGRACLWARLELEHGSLWVGSAHLEVRNTPHCRARQMGHIMSNLPGGHDASLLLGGDFNTNGFPRGTAGRTLSSLARLVLARQSAMTERMRHPERGSEPLFRVARRHGFLWEGLNSDEDTACAPIGDLEDASLLPGFLVKAVRKRLEPYAGRLCFKLDWLLGRGVRSLDAAEARDRETGVTSRAPGCIHLERCGARRPSDHRPIFADILPAR